MLKTIANCFAGPCLLATFTVLMCTQNAHAQQAYGTVNVPDSVLNASTLRWDLPYYPGCTYIRFSGGYFGASGATYGTGRFTAVSDLTYVVLHRNIKRLEDRQGLLTFFAEEPHDKYLIKVVQTDMNYTYAHDPDDRNWETKLWRTLDGLPPEPEQEQEPEQEESKDEEKAMALDSTGVADGQSLASVNRRAAPVDRFAK
ncbi:MAG: hypothetical protein R3C59_29040 [Planctomycetaceae bacterium]